MYLTSYWKALGETDEEKLEDVWKLCDFKWMDTKAGIQIVHDIEDGYSDPFERNRVQIFLRLLDETYLLKTRKLKKFTS